MDVAMIRSLTANPVSGVFSTGTTSTWTLGVTTTPILDGKFVTGVTAASNQASPTTDATTGVAFPAIPGGASVANTPGSGCVAVWGSVGGVIKVSQGPISRLDMQGNFGWDAPQFPALPANFIPFAYQVLKAGATASATAIILGTASWAATGFTNAIVNVFQLPPRPQVS